MKAGSVEESWERKVERVKLAEVELVLYRRKVRVLLDELMRWRDGRKKPENGPS